MAHLARRFAQPRNVYIHVPFCQHRCGYCDFSLMTGRDDLVPKYFAALERELLQSGACHEVDTIYVGGGTPTRLGVRGLETLFRLIQRHFQPTESCEWTVEANPNDIDAGLVSFFLSHRVNRVSLGIQSFSATKLQALDRQHTTDDNLRAIEFLRPISNVSYDLMFAAPHESSDQWQEDLRQALGYPSPHLSTYGLTLEKGTAFFAAAQRGALVEIDEEVQRQMYVAAVDDLEAAGYEHYEISNFAKPGFRSRHNQVYWMGLPFYGFGPAAASYVSRERRVNHRSPVTYMERLLNGESAVDQIDIVDDESHARDRLVFGLRMREGLNEQTFQRETGMDLYALGGEKLQQFIDQGFLEQVDGQLRLTREGLLMSDSMWPDLIGG